VLSEDPGRIADLWQQRLRWARGNVSVTARYRKIWFRPSKVHKLGGWAFGLVWFSLWLLPVAMVTSSIGLVGLLLLHSQLATVTFRALWISAAVTFVYTLALTAQLDSKISRRSWREVISFPGIISMYVMLTAFFPRLTEIDIPGLFGIHFDNMGLFDITLGVYIWIPFSMVGAWIAREVEKTRIGRVVSPALIYLVGYGSLLCAVTFDSYIKEIRHAPAKWDKTEKTGRVMV
jgi:hypothetical protein